MSNTLSTERGPVHAETATVILAQPDRASLKRIAWAMGCAKKGSDEEASLEALLRARCRDLDALEIAHHMFSVG